MPLEMQIAERARVSGRTAGRCRPRIATFDDLLFFLPLATRLAIATPLRSRARDLAVVEGRLDGLKERPMRGMRWRRMVTALSKGGSARSVWSGSTCRLLTAHSVGERVVLQDA